MFALNLNDTKAKTKFKFKMELEFKVTPTKNSHESKNAICGGCHTPLEALDQNTCDESCSEGILQIEFGNEAHPSTQSMKQHSTALTHTHHARIA